MISNLTEVRNELTDYVAKLSNEDVAKKRDNDSWSVLEVLEHIGLAEKGHIDAIENGLKAEANVDSIEKKPVHQSIDRTNKIKTPPFLEPQGIYSSKEQAMGDLTEIRQRLIDIINTHDAELFTQRSLEHPVYGQLSLAQWVEFIWTHEQRHIQQIKEIFGE